MSKFFYNAGLLLLFTFVVKTSTKSTKQPNFAPTQKPTKSPSFNPSKVPSRSPSPSKSPSFRPSLSPSAIVVKPTISPSKVVVSPTASPTSLVSISTWSEVNVPAAVTNPILLTDGRVMLIGVESSSVYLLTPDSFGKYKTGTVKQIASLPAGYCPLYFGSATLPDGRVIIAGGEYNCGGSAIWTNLGAIYDPLTNVWTSVAPPSGSGKIGDAASIVLPDGTFMLQDFFHRNAVTLNTATLTWTRKSFFNKQTS